MRTNKFKIGLLSVAAVLGLGVFSSCSKDFQGDIDAINQRLDNLTKKFDDGTYVTKIEKTANGIKLYPSKGDPIEVTNGKDGRPGTIVKIGEDGFWYIDDVKTDYPAVGKQGPQGKPGEAGPQGKPGEAGPQGKPGADGVYYVPGTTGNEKGFWVKVDPNTKPATRTITTDKWLPAGTISAVYENGVVTLMNVEGAKDGIVKLGQASGFQLKFIPSVVADEGGALPIVAVGGLSTPCENDVTAATRVMLRVSPSNVTVDQIKTDGIYVRYNNPTVLRSAKANPSAKFVSLKDGVLTVDISAQTKYINDEANKIDQIAVVVPMVNGAENESDWAKLDKSVISYRDLHLAKKSNSKLFPTTLDRAKTLAKTLDSKYTGAEDELRFSVVDLQYSETIDLNEQVTTLLKDKVFEGFDVYALSYAFDLKDGTKENKDITFKRGDNDTEQQAFITLDGSKISARVYGQSSNRAAVGRTPIVHVMLMSNDCVVRDAFIVINIVEEKIEPKPVDPIDVVVKASDLSCDGFKYQTDAEWMNVKIYHKANLPKEIFHNNFVWSEETDGVGTITQEKDPEDAESYILVWTVTRDELIEALAEKDNVEISKTGHYKWNGNDIAVTFKTTINRPVFDLGKITRDNYWFDNFSYVRFNTLTPDLGSVDPTLCTFDTPFSNVFKSKEDAGKIVVDFGQVNDGAKVSFVFDKKQPTLAEAFGYTLKPSADGTQLLAVKEGEPTEVVATIVADKKITFGDTEKVTNTYDYVVSYNEDSEIGKKLLNASDENMKARIRIAAENECGVRMTVKGLKDGDSFLVHFLRPVSLDAETTKFFVDGKDFGEEFTWLDINDIVRLKDWRNYVKDTEEYYFMPKHENYFKYYDIQSIKIDTKNIKPIGLKVGGKPETTIPENIIFKQTDDNETVEVVINGEKVTKTFPYGRLTYRNNGSNIDEGFSIEVPVTVTYKWGKINGTVTVPVKKTSELRSL